MITREDRAASIKALLAPVANLSVRRELTMLLLLLAETSIIYIFAGVLLAEQSPPYEPLPASLIFALLVIGYQVPHLLETMRIWTPEYEAVMIAGLAGSLVLAVKVGAFPDAGWLSTGWLSGALDGLILRPSDSVRPVWGLVLLVVYVWWRGRTRAEPVLDTAYGMLRWGTLICSAGLILVWLSASADARIFETISAAVVAFVVFALLAIAVGRQPASGGTANWNASWIWVFVFVLPIAAIAMATVSTAGVLSRETFDLAISVLSPVFWVLGLVLRAFILTIAVLTFILIVPILWFLDRQNFGPFSNIPRLDLAPRNANDFNEFAETTLNIADPVRYLIVGIILTLLGWLLVRYMFRRRKFWQERGRQQQESLIDWSDQPTILLRRASRWLSSRIRRQRSDRMSRDPRWRANRRVRRVYRTFLRMSRKQGIAWRTSGTPNKFAREFALRRQVDPKLVETITDRYNRARYSGRPLPDESADAAEAAFAELREHLQRETGD